MYIGETQLLIVTTHCFSPCFLLLTIQFYFLEYLRTRYNLAKNTIMCFRRRSMVVVLVICNPRTGATLQLSPTRDITKSRSVSLKSIIADFAGRILGLLVWHCDRGGCTLPWLDCTYQSWITIGITRPSSYQLVKTREEFSSRIFQIFTILD